MTDDLMLVPADPPSPLTAEAEKQVRAMAADTYDLTGLSDPMYATTALLLGALRKTLASLDAARAEVKRLAEIHNLTLNAMDAARAPDAGLRALRDEYANLSLPLGSTREAAKHERDTALYYIDRILASSPAPAGRELLAAYGPEAGLISQDEADAIMDPAPAGLDEAVAAFLDYFDNQYMTYDNGDGSSIVRPDDYNALDDAVEALRAATRPAKEPAP